MDNTAETELFQIDCLHQQLVGVLFDITLLDTPPARQCSTYSLSAAQQDSRIVKAYESLTV